MTEAAEKLKPSLLALPETDRWALVGALLDSLPPPPKLLSADDPEFDAILDRRLYELESGKVKGVPAEQVMQRLREKYRR